MPLSKIAMADGTTQKILGEAIITGVASRCLTVGCADQEFLIMLANWTAAITEGIDEIASSLAEAGYEAEVHEVDFDRSVERKMRDMISLTGRFKAPSKEEEEMIASRMDSVSDEEEAAMTEFKDW